MKKAISNPASQVTPLAKEDLGLAAEYAVASELCRRGIYAQLTLGNRKRTDLLLDLENGHMLRVQVKAKQKRDWPACKGVCGNSNILVFVDYENKNLTQQPDFYVLTELDWKNFLQVELTESGRAQKWRCTWGADLVPRSDSGIVGITLRASQINVHRDRWDKIEALMQTCDKHKFHATSRTGESAKPA